MSQFVHEFREILEHLERRLPRQVSEQSDSKTPSDMRSLKNRLLWPFKKEDTQKQIQKIEWMKTTIAVKLQLWVAHIFCS